jgi:LacI family transcriptional regulator
MRQEIYVEGFRTLSAPARPVVVFNDDIPGVFRDAVVSPDMVRSGRMAAELLGKFLNGRGKAAAITGWQNRLSYVQRVEGFRREMGTYYRGIELLPLVQYEGGDDNAHGCTCELLATHKDLGGIYSVDGSTAAVGRAIMDSGRSGDVKLVGHELSDDVRAMIRIDCVQAVVCQEPFQQGYGALRTLYRVVADRQEPLRQDTLCPLTITMRNSLESPQRPALPE